MSSRLAAESPARIAAWCRIHSNRRRPVEESSAQGLAVDIELSFEQWLGATPLRAEAFLDPGADCSIISLRWIREQHQAGSVWATACLTWPESSRVRNQRAFRWRDFPRVWN